MVAFRSDDVDVEYVAFLDAEGDVRWLQQLPGEAREVLMSDIRLLADGTLLGIRNGQVVHYDMLGRMLHRLLPESQSEEVDDVSAVVRGVEILFHHEVRALADGSGIYALATNAFPVEGFPVSYLDASNIRRTTIADDLVVEVGWDGALQAAWSLAERLDPLRIGWDSLERRGGHFDWAHANAVVFDPEWNAYIVTLRHQDAVVAIDRGSGDVSWILAPQDNWQEPHLSLLLRPEGPDFRIPWHAHATEVTPQRTLLLFDNHNFASSPFTGDFSTLPPENVSRLAEFHVNEADGTVEQVWQYNTPPEGVLYAPAMGDADHLPLTGNVLGVWGRVTFMGNQPLDERGLGNQAVRILEVTRTTPPDVVFDLRMSSSLTELPSGWTCNRAERVPSLYGSASPDLPPRKR